ncbi:MULTISPECIES: hypothetical protein [unclassified Xanthomonas]|uniref:hypothetical protein n=1 Tax=Xanthomonas sp. LMG 8992 TaxID=1591157 RepID=UPI00136F0539|nr:hypothetical protein [Xanthomonas sp. LMG 8992]
MIPSSLSSFISDVLKATSSGVLGWHEINRLGQDIYVCERNGYKIQIGSHWNDDAEVMSITFSIEMPGGEYASFSTSHWEDDYQQMRVLLEHASVSAAKISPDSLRGFFSG